MELKSIWRVQVAVRSYERRRHGQRERVRAHLRGWPRQPRLPGL